MGVFDDRTIPTPNSLPNVRADAQRVFEVLQSGGVVILPTEVGYGFMATSTEAIDRAFAAKRRRPGHSQGLYGTHELHQKLHVLDDRRFEMTRVLVEDLDMSLMAVAPCNQDHHLLQALSPETRSKVIKDDTIAMFISTSSLIREVCRLNATSGQLMVGSSANVSGGGQKFRVEDIEDEVKEAADLIVDYGLQRYHIYGRASLIMDFGQMKVLRMGSCYELFRERMRKFWGWSCPKTLITTLIVTEIAVED
ncbi:hypothetical protein N7462_010430 [Penicillium macrosclerotiorum]|uniref:uncharacterized protein n=1 Tax=Penicillium macrosclerotiorum TaxID=303699 RepID=UPI0025479C95|nr:uncharacterized protein N7462_010430 [Penicillium macrosclerotiorum]KAJ5669360.1 hypothetical protein N7462_010430 [Penicillium macrosclerotiorum]